MPQVRILIAIFITDKEIYLTELLREQLETLEMEFFPVIVHKEERTVGTNVGKPPGTPKEEVGCI